ncbi:hypothetical protein [Ectopseudomonas mendocina]|uniref:hypothetical protein n=1 Tax=Ectopseudomonas mendocina TaxID=300 RepID=UPI00376F23E9
MKPTVEELLLQILSTCLLINSQGIHHASLELLGGHGLCMVTVEPVVGLEAEEEEARYWAALKDHDQPEPEPGPTRHHATLAEQLEYLQRYLLGAQEAAA